MHVLAADEDSNLTWQLTPSLIGACSHCWSRFRCHLTVNTLAHWCHLSLQIKILIVLDNWHSRSLVPVLIADQDSILALCLERKLCGCLMPPYPFSGGSQMNVTLYERVILQKQSKMHFWRHFTAHDDTNWWWLHLNLCVIVCQYHVSINGQK